MFGTRKGKGEISMAVFRVKLFSQNEGEHKEGNDRQYCIDKKIFAIGWGNENAETFKEYQEKLKNKNISRGQKISLNNINKEMKDGDYIWAQKDGRTYLLGKICGETFIDKSNKRIGPARKCNWKNLEFDDVPGKILSCFVGFGATLQKVNVDDNFEKYCEWLYKDKKSNICLDNYKSLLHSDDLEDLLGLYLQKKYGYFILPSSNKQGSKLIEFELRNEQGEKACIQCKIGESTVGETLFNDKDFKNYKIYISTFRDDDYNKYGNNVETIKTNELFCWAKDNMNILPERIKNYIKITKN